MWELHKKQDGCHVKTRRLQNKMAAKEKKKTSKAKPTSLPGIIAVMSGSNDQVK